MGVLGPFLSILSMKIGRFEGLSRVNRGVSGTYIEVTRGNY